MSLNKVTESVKERAKTESPLGVIIKFVFPEGQLWIDGKGEANVVMNSYNIEPDCTLTMKLETFEKLRDKRMNPMVALMMGKIKLSGDSTAALKLKSIL